MPEDFRLVERPCEVCGQQLVLKNERDIKRKRFCSQVCLGKGGGRGKDSNSWKGGRTICRGYVVLTLQPDDFFFRMASVNGQVREHRLVMAKHLNRCLLPWEIVHHKNGIREDNRIENLQLLGGRYYHISDSKLKQEVKKQARRIEALEQRIILIEAENIILKSQREEQNVDA